MNLIFALFLSFADIILMNAQEIRFNFPSFKGDQYTFCLIQGEKNDTISKGTIPKDGKFSIRIPEKYKGYKGMGKWFLKKGGGLALVINNENFVVESKDSLPNHNNIYFKNSPENEFLIQQFYQQKEVLSKYAAVTHALEVYDANERFYPILKSEQMNLRNEYEAFRHKLDSVNLYAADFRRISDAVAGLSDYLFESEEDQRLELINYITYRMNWGYLYTSGHWQNMISQWIQLQLKVYDEPLFIKNIQLVASKIKENEPLYLNFVNSVNQELSGSKNEYLLELLSQ